MNGLNALLSSGALNATAIALLHFLWQGTLVALLLAGALAVIPRRRAELRVFTAGTALAVMLVFPVATAAILLTSGDLPEASPGFTLTPLVSGVSGETGADPVSTPGFASTLTSGSAAARSALPLLVLGWLLGVVALSMRNLRDLLSVRRLLRQDTFPVPDAPVAALSRLVTRLGVVRHVRLIGSHRVSVPTVVGWLRPVILVPAGALTGLHPQELEAILAHELAHVRRHDYLVNLLQTVVETLLFYHPAVWWVSRQIRLERENACDDVAVQVCGDPAFYARALTRMEGLRGTPAFALGADGGSLLHRVRRLVGAKSEPSSRVTGFRVPGALTVLGALTLGLLYLGSQGAVSNAAVKQIDPNPVIPGADEGYAFGLATDDEDTTPAIWGVTGGTRVSRITVGSSDSSPRIWRVSSHGGNSGKWSARYRSGQLEIDVRIGGSHWGESNDVSEFGFTEEQVEALLASDEISFSLPQDAGTFAFEGEVDSRGRATTASGTFTFKPDPDYVRKMEALGFSGDEVEDRQMELAGHYVTLDYARAITEAGYQRISVDRLMEFRIHGIDADYVRGMNDTGYRDLPAERLVEFKIHGISPGYVQDLVNAGYADLPAERLVEFKIHGIDADYAGGLAQAGYAHMSPRRIVEFKIHGISPRYVEDLVGAGYADLPAERLVEFKIHGIDADYAGGLARSGYAHMNPKRIVEFKIHGISAEYVRDLAQLGYDRIPAEKLVELKIHGVTPAQIRDLQDEGYKDLTVDELIEIRIQGFDRFLKRRSR